MSLSIHRLTSRSSGLIVFESLLIVCAVAMSAFLFLGPEGWHAFLSQGGPAKALLITAICQLCLYYCNVYDLTGTLDQRALFERLLRALGAASIILAAIYFWIPALVIGRGVFLWAAGIVIPLVIGWRLVFDWLASHTAPSEKLLIVGTSAAAVGLARELIDRRRELGVEIVGFVDPDPARIAAAAGDPGIIGTVEDIPSIVTRGVDRVVVSLADARGMLPMDKLLAMKLDGVRFDHLASVYEEYTGKIALENLRPSWFIFSQGFRKSAFTRVAKRVMDIGASLVLLVITAPIMALVALAVRLTSPGPVLYHQERVGLGGRVFTLHKFRSMRQDAEVRTGAVWAQPNDHRLTSVGAFLRKTRADELPQLWNILRGEMSLVGPRPERPTFVADLTRQIPFYGQRHVVKPGLTGWAQVRYAYGASVEDAMEKLQYDLFYIKNMSLALDLFILFETAKTVILRQGT